jgi:glucosamine-6-phosphate deaminase
MRRGSAESGYPVGLTPQIHDSAEQLASTLARDIVAAIARKPDIVLGLPAGRTPILLYRELVAASRAQGLDWSRVRTFNLDEFVTPQAEARQPYQQFMLDHLLCLVNVPPDRTDFPNGRAADLHVECDRYERAIAAAGGLDLVLLGIGASGHIGFNEPGLALAARTHATTLTDESRVANAWLFDGQIDRVPTVALTMGMATILSARRIVLVATGDKKAATVSAMIGGGITTSVPASFLQLHPDVTILIDEPAAAHLAR